jgi:hypothetical protein
MSSKSVFAKIIVAFFLVSLVSIPTSVEGEVPDHSTYLEPGEYHYEIFNAMTNQPSTDIKIIIGDVQIGSGSKNANNTTDEFSPIDIYIMSEEQLNSYIQLKLLKETIIFFMVLMKRYHKNVQY